MGYADILRRRVALGGKPVTLLVKSGMVAWDEVEIAATLLAESAEIGPGQRVLLLEGGGGALAVWATRQGAEVHYCDDSLVAERMAVATLEANEIEGVTVHSGALPPEALAGTFDAALLPLPKGRAYAQALLGTLAHMLKPDGRLYLAGPNGGGAKSVLKDAGAILGRSATIRTKARNRVGLAVRLADADLTAPTLADFHEFEAAGLRLFSTPGVFSWQDFDDGSQMLVGTLGADAVTGRRVLDVGCGSGVIGLYAAQLGAAAVDMVDASRLAVASAQQGIQANALPAACRAWASDLYTDVPDDGYDYILSNPPFHAGHAVDTEAAQALITGARDRLAEGGVLRLVANVFLPYERLVREVFGAGKTRIVVEDARYRVIEGGR